MFLLTGGSLFAQQAKIEKSQLKGLIREFKGEPGFEGINLGSMLLSIAKLADDTGETVKMYGTCLPDGQTIENLIIYCEEDGALICLWGTINSKDIDVVSEEVR